MKVYEIRKTQFLNNSLDIVFNFFSRPENLKKITPEKLSFKIITPPPINMGKGTIIDYTIKLFKFPIHWRTIITTYEPPHLFVDQQLKGPYKFWHHSHTFESKNGGVEIIDRVQYIVPLGWIGQILNYFWIAPDLEKIFEYRKNVIHKYFNKITNENKERKNI